MEALAGFPLPLFHTHLYTTGLGQSDRSLKKSFTFLEIFFLSAVDTYFSSIYLFLFQSELSVAYFVFSAKFD